MGTREGGKPHGGQQGLPGLGDKGNGQGNRRNRRTGQTDAKGDKGDTRQQQGYNGGRTKGLTIGDDRSILENRRDRCNHGAKGDNGQRT